MASSVDVVRGVSLVRPARIAAIVGVLLLPVLSSCAVLFNGTTQLVPVASTPPRAEVFVDGVSQGFTPIELTLRRGRDHTVTLRLGDLERTILVTKQLQPMMVALDLAPVAAMGLVVVAFRALPQDDPSDMAAVAALPFLGAALLGAPVPLVVDAATGAWYELDPAAIEVDFGVP